MRFDRIVGFDTDTKGGYGVIDLTRRVITASHYYTRNDTSVKDTNRLRLDLAKTSVDFIGTFGRPTNDLYVLEEQRGMPKQNSVSVFTLGLVNGHLQGMLTLTAEAMKPKNTYKVVYHHSTDWKHGMGVTAEKQTNIDLFFRLFPNAPKEYRETKNITLCEGVLIAIYGYAQWYIDDGKKPPAIDWKKFSVEKPFH